MSSYLWLVASLAVLIFLACRARRIWIDGGRHGVAHRLRWTLVGTVSPSRYWWGARIEVLSPQEQADLLARRTAELGLSHADSLRCPLCRTEVVHAWILTSDRRATVAPDSKCPKCDFRLDACRHCAHFLPGAPRTGPISLSAGDDATFGHCSFYRVPQPTEQVCSPEIARRLKERGWETVRAPLPIVDSFLPPDFCTAFTPDRKRLRASDVKWPDAHRVALLRLLAPSPALKATVSEEPSSDEQWLL
jgi:hypothetical protein